MTDPALIQAAPHIAAGRFPQALTILRRALDKNPTDYELLARTVDLLCKSGQHAQGVYITERAIRIDPRNKQFHMLAGDTLMRAAKYDVAAEAFTQAYRLEPTDLEPLRARCIALYQHGNYEGALVEAKSLYDQYPTNPKALAAYTGMCELAGNLDELVRVLTLALKRSPNDIEALAALVLPLARVHGLDPKVVFQYHVQLGQLMMQMIRNQAELLNRPHHNIPDPERPLNIGYCSQDFRNRSAGHFIEPIITHHDKSMYKVFVFHNVVSEDELTKRIAKHATRYIDTSKTDDKVMTDMIRDLRIDILVDLSGHTGWGRLVPFALKPAPIQYTYMGYPNTTGLPTIDYRIVDAFTDPPGSDHLATEKLVRMDGCFLRHERDMHATEHHGNAALAKVIGQGVRARSIARDHADPDKIRLHVHGDLLHASVHQHVIHLRLVRSQPGQGRQGQRSLTHRPNPLADAELVHSSIGHDQKNSHGSSLRFSRSPNQSGRVVDRDYHSFRRAENRIVEFLLILPFPALACGRSANGGVLVSTECLMCWLHVEVDRLASLKAAQNK